jgi:hypothetical protein
MNNDTKQTLVYFLALLALQAVIVLLLALALHVRG